MKLKLSTILANLLILANVIQLCAQQNHKQENNSKRVVIESVPPGALVELSGAYSFVGRTPYVIPYYLYGKYKIKASKEGYESVNSEIILAQRGVNYLTVRLHPKTRFKAAIRSFVVPGWGQIYGQNRFKGLLLTAGQVGLGLVTVLANNNYNREKDDYDLALNRFNESKFNLGEAEKAYLAVQKEFKEADDALGFRNTMVYLTVGFWIYNIFDSILFFSKERSGFKDPVRRSPYFSGQINQNQMLLSMQVDF